MFDIRKENFKNELSDGQNNKDLEFKKRLLKRRAFSPNLQNTYLALSNINFHNDRYQEQPKNIKLKLVRAYIMQREQESKDGNQSNLINESKGGDDIKKTKNQLLLSMMKKYTYKFLKSPEDYQSSGSMYQKLSNKGK